LSPSVQFEEHNVFQSVDSTNQLLELGHTVFEVEAKYHVLHQKILLHHVTLYFISQIQEVLSTA
jgi:hypothetical protein